jgi:hypothetical protein
MTVSATLKQSAFLQETEEVYLILLTIAHADLASSIRVVDNNEDITSNGNLFTAFPFQADLPDSREDAPARAKLVIDNTSQEIAQAIRTITSAASITIEVIRAADPDTIEKTWSTFTLRNVEWGSDTVQGDLILEDVENEPYPFAEFNPAQFQGMY